jgi:CBS domain-containing protein
MLQATAGDLMREELITCHEVTPAVEVARLLVASRVHALVVTNHDDLPVGVVSASDLLAGDWLSRDPDDVDAVRALTAGQLMTHPILTIDVTAPSRIVVERMEEEGVSRLVVTEQGKPLGVVTVSDVVAGLAEGPKTRETVADVMSRAIVVAFGSTPVANAARAMTERRSRTLVVVDRTGRPLGLVTGHDLVRLHLWDVEAKTIAELMRPPVAIGPDAPLQDAADLMLTHGTSRLLVVDPAYPRGVPLGLVSTMDIVEELADPGSVWQEPYHLER